MLNLEIRTAVPLRSIEIFLADFYLEEDSDSLNSPPSCQEFLDGDIVWGPLQGHPSWPGKVVGAGQEEGHLLVCWYGGRQLTQVYTEIVFM